jgi:hypothetical protein
METDKAIIYGIKSNGEYHYIGKTIKQNKQGVINKSHLVVAYHNEKISSIFNNDNVNIEKLHEVDSDKWYDVKFHEVIKKYNEQHPLKNAQWMLDGKRGPEYWTGKQRDANTLQRLSESKYIRICQYDVNGHLVKIWNSAREIGVNVFNDYKVVNGSAKSKIYQAIKNNKINSFKSHFKLNSYWFKETDLINNFNTIPTRIHIDVILKQEKDKRQKHYKPLTHSSRYTVIQYDNNGRILQKFDNTHHAAFVLNIDNSRVNKLCSGNRHDKRFNLTYGEKKLQPINMRYE